MEKWKLWEIEQEWRQKNQVMAPFNRELMADMRAICKAHGIKSHFTEVWENKKTAPKGEGK